MESLSNFLKAHSANGSNDWTHTSIKNPKGSFIIPNNELNDFYKLYNIALNHGNELYITERCNDYSPIRIDIDFRLENTQEKPPATLNHFYNKNHYLELSKEIWKIVKDYIKINNKNASQVYITEKKCPSLKSNGDIGDGFHIIFPELCCSAKFQLYLRQKLLNSGVINQIFADIPFSNNIEDIYDSGIIERNWTLYGSIGKLDGPLYKITCIYDIEKDSEKGVNGNQLFSEDTINHLSVRNKEEKILEFKSDSLKFEVDTWYNNVFNKNNIRSNIDNKRIIALTAPKVVDLEQVKALVGILSSKRASHYDDWIRVCWCLRNIHENLFDDFDKFSQKDRKKYDYQSVLRVWNSPNRKEEEGLQLGTLYYWAKKDNLEDYNAILDKDIASMIANHPKTNRGIASIIYKKYGTEFVCINPASAVDKRIWYRFDGLIWRPKAYHVLRDFISNDTMKNYFTAENQKYHDLSEEFDLQIDELKGAEKKKKQKDKKIIDKQLKHVNDICISLETSSFIDNVAKEAGFMMINPEFEDVINKNPNLIAFTNGVLDLNTMTLREGLPSDLITITTGIDYDPRPPHINDVKKFLSEILPNKAVRDYTLYYLASCLYGENDQQKLVVMTGEGGNGKSLLIKLIEQVMGDYMGTLDVAYVTQKRAHSSKASPEVLSLRHKRIGIIQEPDKHDVLNMGIVKQLTGNDNVVARPLFGELVKFNNTAKLIMLCNDIPAPSSQDDGVWRRLRVINFPMKFVDDPVEPNERKRDYTIEKKFKNWNSSFMGLLLKYYKKYVEVYNRKIPEPAEIKEFTNTYMEGHNDFLAFCRAILVKETDNGKEKPNVISNTELYSKLKQWYDAENLGKCPPKKEFMPYLKKTYGKAFTQLHGLKGYIFKPDEEPEDDEDDIVVIGDNEDSDNDL